MFTKHSQPPLDVQIETTTFCNASCLHCYNFWRGDKSKQNNTKTSDITQSRNNLSTIVNELSKNKIFKATFTGGEPLTSKKGVLEGERLCKEAGIDCSLNSNLTTITRDTARQLKELDIDSVLTTLHSYDENIHDYITQRKGSFLRTLRGIKYCLEEDLDISVNMVVMKANQNQIFKTGKFAHEQGVKSFYATKVAPCINGTNYSEISVSKQSFEKMLEDLLLLEKNFEMNTDTLMTYPICALKDLDRYEKFAQHKCRAGITICTIGANGDIRPCSLADESYGNIFSGSLSEAWSNMRDWRDGSRLPERCIQGCKYFPLCGGGCRMEAKFAGNKKGIDPLATSPDDIIPWPLYTQSQSPAEFMKKQFIYATDVKMRKEIFGGAVAAKGAMPLLIDSDGYETLSELTRLNGSFSIQVLKDNLGLSPDSHDFFYTLFKNGILKEVK